MDAKIEGIAGYKVTVNDELIDKGYFNMQYDGDTLDVAGVAGDKIILMSLDDNDINSLLAKPAANKTLLERLSNDYGDKPNIQEGPILEVLSETKKTKKSKKGRGTKKHKKRHGKKQSRRKTPKKAREKMLSTHTPVVGPTARYYKKD